MAIRKINKLLPSHNLINTGGKIVWEHWRKLKEEYHINGVSMRSLIQGAFAILVQRSKKNKKKGSINEREAVLYKTFLVRKKRATFGGVARFCPVTTAMKFSTWDNHASRASMRDDP